VSHYGCQFVGHGDDITSDSSGEDCYRFVKAAGRFKVFKRTPNISTTDLVGRMLLCTRSHFIRSLEDVLAGKEGDGGDAERKARGDSMFQRIRDYATDDLGFNPSVEVWSWTPATAGYFRADNNTVPNDPGSFKLMAAGKAPRPGQRIAYVDGGFDLFSSGHIEFLRRVAETEEELGKKNGWYEPAAREARLKESGEDYAPAFVIAGVHDDAVINHFKGVNYPIMNIFERGLCVLQCKVGHFGLHVLHEMLTYAVCSCNHLFCTICTYRSVLEERPAQFAISRLSWTNFIHAIYARPIRRCKGTWHL
jgi:ethanolamine-phosphate cytidylyltransferase